MWTFICVFLNFGSKDQKARIHSFSIGSLQSWSKDQGQIGSPPFLWLFSRISGSSLWSMFLWAPHSREWYLVTVSRGENGFDWSLCIHVDILLNIRGMLKRCVNFPSCFLSLLFLGSALGLYMYIMTNFMAEVWHLGTPGIRWWSFFPIKLPLKLCDADRSWILIHFTRIFLN